MVALRVLCGYKSGGGDLEGLRISAIKDPKLLSHSRACKK